MALRASPADARAPSPKVGVCCAWFDPEDPYVWSGVPRAFIQELRHLGVYAGALDATPWAPASRALHRVASVGSRRYGWTLNTEMRALARVTDAINRWTTPREVDAWVHLIGGYGRIVRGRYATLFEMSPSQLAGAAREWGAVLGFPGASPTQIRWVARRQQSVYEHAHACCVASRWAADSLVSDHGIPASKVHVVGYGRNLEVAEPKERDWSVPRFLFVGRDWHRKNGDAVVAAFARLHREISGARLDVVGEHPPLSLEGVEGHGRVEIADPSGRAMVEELYRQATCFVLPSLFEPFGIVYAEAGFAGIPSIAGSIGGTADSVGAGGIIVDPHDHEALYAAMRELSDPATAQAHGALARQHASGLTWAQTAAGVLHALDLDQVTDVTGAGV